MEAIQIFSEILEQECMKDDEDEDEDGFGDQSEAPKRLFSENIHKEVLSLRNVEKKPFVSLPLGPVTCLVFIQFRKVSLSPELIAEKIFLNSDADSPKAARFCQRLIPIHITCQARLNELVECVRPLITKHFHEVTDKSFTVNEPLWCQFIPIVLCGV